jgi:putative Holliday junction resolvase
MRILGLDFGDRRIGVAVSDELEITAQAIGVIERRGRRKDLAEIGKIISLYSVEKIIVGYPLRLDGTAGIQCRKVDRFIEDLVSVFPLPVIRWDETLTTFEAEELLKEAKVGIKKRRKLVDKIAAGMILQSYLDSRRKKDMS